MKRWMKWGAALVVVVAAGGFVANKMYQRKLAAKSSVGAAAPLELSGLDVLSLRPQEITRTLAISGGLKASSSAVVKAKVAAELKSLTVREGDAVKAGQIIGKLDTAEFDLRIKQAEQTALSARTQLDIAKRALTNNQALVAQGFISTTGMATSVSNEAGARATYQAAAAATDLARKARADAVLVSPITGVVSQRLVQPGERVGIDARVVEIVDLSQLELEANLAPEDVSAVQLGQTVRLTVEGLSTAVAAQVARINPSAQANTRAVTVYLALQQSPQTQPSLRQGLFVSGVIELERKTALTAPVSAVRIDQARPYVLTVETGKVVQRTVELGVRGEVTANGRTEAAVELITGAPAGTALLRGTVGGVRAGTLVKLMSAAPAASASVGY
jgi:membrane fusion protein, multidrug efflux system